MTQIRFDCDDLIALPEIPSRLPPVDGKRLNHSTVWRWATRGRNGYLLPTIKIGRQRFTTPDALQDFLTESDPLNGNGGDELSHPDAERFLASEGL
jgi:hypothetical protein